MTQSRVVEMLLLKVKGDGTICPGSTHAHPAGSHRLQKTSFLKETSRKYIGGGLKALKGNAKNETRESKALRDGGYSANQTHPC